jgi:hypothetical protein
MFAAVSETAETVLCVIFAVFMAVSETLETVINRCKNRL